MGNDNRTRVWLVRWLTWCECQNHFDAKARHTNSVSIPALKVLRECVCVCVCVCVVAKCLCVVVSTCLSLRGILMSSLFFLIIF